MKKTLLLAISLYSVNLLPRAERMTTTQYLDHTLIVTEPISPEQAQWELFNTLFPPLQRDRNFIDRALLKIGPGGVAAGILGTALTIVGIGALYEEYMNPTQDRAKRNRNLLEAGFATATGGGLLALVGYLAATAKT